MSRAVGQTAAATAAGRKPHADTRTQRSESRSTAPADRYYVERALLLWPRLDRSRLRRYGGNPSRIAEYVGRRTSQPLDVILAMLTRQAPDLAPATAEASRVEPTPAKSARVAIHIVRDDEPSDLPLPILA